MSPTRRTLVQAIAGGALVLGHGGMPADTTNDFATLRTRLAQLRDDAMASWERCFEEDEWSSKTSAAIGLVDALEAVIMATCPHSRENYYPSDEHHHVLCCPLCDAEAEVAPQDIDALRCDWDVFGYRDCIHYVVAG